MNKETLARAKELEKDIQQMEFALSYYKRGKWSHWEYANDSASSFHFEFCKNWSHRDADMQDLPTWLNKPLMEVVERELERCKTELDNLGNEKPSAAESVVENMKQLGKAISQMGVKVSDAPEAGQDTLDPSMAAMAASFELDKPRKTSWKDGAVRTLDRLISWMLYSMTFCFLLGVTGLDLSVREIIAYSLMLGLVVGSINNIERVMRELFRKED